MRLIDADATKKSYCEKCKGYFDGHCIHQGECDVDVIETSPTIEAQPVKHGEWETWGFVFHGIEWKRCSECGKPADVSYSGILEGMIEMATSGICSCCGAKMDGGNADGQALHLQL